MPSTLVFFSGVGASRPVLLHYYQCKTGRLAPYRYKVDGIGLAPYRYKVDGIELSPSAHCFSCRGTVDY